MNRARALGEEAISKNLEPTATKSRLRTYIEAASWLAGILSLVATIFIFYKSEQNKELSITYFPKRPLVNIDPGRPTPKLEVDLGGVRIAAPWLLSARLENTGTQPIEAKDIEEQIKLHFGSARIVGAEITEKSQSGIFVKTFIDGKSVVVEHKLLNPNDWITFDFLFDGEPDVPPQLSLRISGISKPKQNIMPSSGKELRLSLFDIPRAPLLSLLIASSIAPLGLIVIGIMIAFEGIVHRIGPEKLIADDMESYFVNRIINEIAPTTRLGKILIAGITERISIKELDDKQFIERAIFSTVTTPLLEALNLTLSEAAIFLMDDLKDSLKKDFSKQVFAWASDEDKAKKEHILSIDAHGMSAQEIVKTCTKILQEATSRLHVRRRIDYTELMGGIALLFLGVSIAIIIGGTWRNYLGV